MASSSSAPSSPTQARNRKGGFVVSGTSELLPYPMYTSNKIQKHLNSTSNHTYKTTKVRPIVLEVFPPKEASNKRPGRTRLDRLVHIGICSTSLGTEALKLAVREAKQGKDVRRYLEAVTHLETIGPDEPEAVRDKAWVDRTEKQNLAETHRLEAELKGYKNNLVKESIRVRWNPSEIGWYNC